MNFLKLIKQFIQRNLKAQSDVNEIIKLFKSKEYYPRINKCYAMKLEDFSKDNEPLLYELTFFLFNEKIKLILNNDPNKILSDNLIY